MHTVEPGGTPNEPEMSPEAQAWSSGVPCGSHGATWCGGCKPQEEGLVPRGAAAVNEAQRPTNDELFEAMTPAQQQALGAALRGAELRQKNEAARIAGEASGTPKPVDKQKRKYARSTPTNEKDPTQLTTPGAQVVRGKAHMPVRVTPRRGERVRATNALKKAAEAREAAKESKKDEE